LRFNTRGLRPRSAAFMRSIAASGGRASRGKPKTGRRRTSRDPRVALSEKLSPYQVLRGEPAVLETARVQGHGAWLLEAQEPVTMLRVARPRRGVRIYWQCPGCRRRVALLYRPQLKTRFRCRRCHGLRYGRAKLRGSACLNQAQQAIVERWRELSRSRAEREAGSGRGEGGPI
jgi:hypothetical protein